MVVATVTSNVLYCAEQYSTIEVVNKIMMLIASFTSFRVIFSLLVIFHILTCSCDNKASANQPILKSSSDVKDSQIPVLIPYDMYSQLSSMNQSLLPHW